MRLTIIFWLATAIYVQCGAAQAISLPAYEKSEAIAANDIDPSRMQSVPVEQIDIKPLPAPARPAPPPAPNSSYAPLVISVTLLSAAALAIILYRLRRKNAQSVKRTKNK